LLRLFKRVGFRDYARFDWKMDKHGNPRLLEGNCNCGWSYDAHLQRMCALADISYSGKVT
jgi:D-alanine-D-alanine ligase